MTAAILGSVGAVFGALLLSRAIRPRAASIPSILESLEGPGESESGAGGPDQGLSGLRWRARSWATPYLEGSFLDTPSLRRDLSITSGSVSHLAGEMAVAGAGTALAIAGASAMLALTVAEPPLALPAFLVLIGGVGGAMIPLFALKKRASTARKAFRRALGTFLELVGLAMAGAMGIEGALDAVSNISDDSAFERLRNSINVARLAGRPPWQTLGALGEEIGVPELSELATNLVLAGSEGARVRQSLSSKASTLRRRELAEAEAEANSTTEKMFVPGVLLLVGFMIFVGYPAVVHVFRTL